MKWFSNWFESKGSEHSDVPSQPDRREPEKGVFIPQKSAVDATPTLPVLTSLDASFFEVAESDGFDPYNSGSFETKKSRSYK